MASLGYALGAIGWTQGKCLPEPGTQCSHRLPSSSAENPIAAALPVDVVNSRLHHCELDLVNRYSANYSAKFFGVCTLGALYRAMFMENFSNSGMSLFIRPSHRCRPRRVR